MFFFCCKFDALVHIWSSRSEILRSHRQHVAFLPLKYDNNIKSVFTVFRTWARDQHARISTIQARSIEFIRIIQFPREFRFKMPSYMDVWRIVPIGFDRIRNPHPGGEIPSAPPFRHQITPPIALCQVNKSVHRSECATTLPIYFDVFERDRSVIFTGRYICFWVRDVFRTVYCFCI